MDQSTLRFCVAVSVIGLMVWMIGFGVVLRRQGVHTNAIAEQNTNWMQRALIAGAGLLDLYLVLRAPIPSLDRFVAASPAPAPWVAFAIIIAGAAIIVLSQYGMGRSWRVGVPGEANHVEKLIVQGLHKYSRNPVYLGIMLFLIGAALAAPGPLTAFAVFVSYLGLTRIIRQEERYLSERFGEEYNDYKKRVRRWL